MSANTQGISFLHRFDLGNRDLVDPGSNILYVSSTAVGDFDKANLTTESVRNVWRSADILTEQEIIIRAELPSIIDTFSIIGHNLTPIAVVRLEANTSNNFVAPPVQVVIPWAKHTMVMTQNLGQTYEYYRLRILDPANPCGYIEVGRTIGGRAFTFTNNEDMEDDFDIAKDDNSERMKSEGFFRVSAERVKAKSLRFRFSKIRTDAPNDDNYNGLEDLFDHVGITKPFLTIIDRNDPTFNPIWGQMDRIPGFAYTVNRFASTSMTVQEVF
ncbi:MAG: hypothetical protein SGI96_21190 [Bacteroidota bacterium]|nr:hypothetical protein [Bacteroidota bacterium]